MRCVLFNSLTYVYIYIYIYIKSSDKALDSYKEKVIHWNLNLTECRDREISDILNDFYIGVSTSLP